MRKVFVILQVAILLSLLLAVLSCSGQGEKSSTQADLTAIRDLVEEWKAATAAKDLERVASLYTDDIVRMPPNEPSSVGKEALKRVHQFIFENLETEVIWPLEGTEEIIVAGDWAIHISEYKQRFTPIAGGETVEDHGKLIEIIQKQKDGSWKFAREMWSSNLPLQSP